MNPEPAAKKAKLIEDNISKSGLEQSNTVVENISSEQDVGICEYLSESKGFSAIIKQRFSDFLVNEIDNEGNVVHLTEIEAPSGDTDTKAISQEDGFLDEWQTELQELQDSADSKSEVIIEVGENKEIRTSIHEAIRKGFDNLDSKTDDRHGKKCICVKWVKHKTVRGSAGRPSWPKGRGNYVKFVLYKENRDTMDAVGAISHSTRIQPKVFSYAGTKDKRAKTSQEITAFRVPIEKLIGLNKNSQRSQITLGNFRYVKDELKLGCLKGNRFTIVLRNVLGCESDIEKCLTSLKEIGFINYYGMQRFGTTSIPTHHVGRELLKGNWKEAVFLILKPRSHAVDMGKNQGLVKAREIWMETKNAEDALQAIGGKHCVEKYLLTGLKQHSNDYPAALAKIPRNSRLLYLHAYQSFIWNKIVSHRLTKFGRKVLLGDLVIPLNLSDCSKEKYPRRVTEDNLTDWDIYDVVMPLPGYDIKYPDNEIHKWYMDFLQEDNLNKSNLKSTIKDYSLPGDYRHLLVKPKDVSWEKCCYNDVAEPLVLTDLDRLKSVSLTEQPKDGKFQALVLELTLPASSYATMALRELMKQGTSPADQMSLNVV